MPLTELGAALLDGVAINMALLKELSGRSRRV